jgi:hypothetical protein
MFYSTRMVKKKRYQKDADLVGFFIITGLEKSGSIGTTKTAIWSLEVIMSPFRSLI